MIDKRYLYAVSLFAAIELIVILTLSVAVIRLSKTPDYQNKSYSLNPIDYIPRKVVIESDEINAPPPPPPQE